MNPFLAHLQPYPFQKMQQLKQGITPPEALMHIPLSIGEPQTPYPAFINEVMQTHLNGLGCYPTTKGTPLLREAIADWLCRRFELDPSTIDPERHLLPVNGTREALFALAQCVVDRADDACVVMPNPFYQIYEGAALLAGAEPYFLNMSESNGWVPDYAAVPESVWQRCQLLYLCSPSNPTGAITSLETYQELLELADRYDFVIASDECYSEIYWDEQTPPPGLLQAAALAGRDNYERCMVFHSLSKRSNLPGLRSGFVAGDAKIVDQFLLYRTYHGSAMSLQNQAASIAAWQDEQHVIDNRQGYRERFQSVVDILSPVLNIEIPKAAFYLWPETPMSDTEFARRLFEEQHVTVIPGTYLARKNNGINPGTNRIRIAVVAEIEECVIAAERIRSFVSSL